MLAPVFAGRDKSVRALEQAYAWGSSLVVAAQKSVAVEEPVPRDIEHTGTLAKVVQFFRLSDGTVKALVEGQNRVRVTGYTSEEPYFAVTYTPLESRPASNRTRLQALIDSIIREFSAYVSQSPQLPEEAETAVDSSTSPEEIADIVAAHLLMSATRKQILLEGEEVEGRLVALLETLIEENELLALENDIAERVQEKMQRYQRQAYLRERMRVLRDELAEETEEEGEQGDYLNRLRAANLPEGAATSLEKEIRRLPELGAFTAEVAVAKNYLDHALGLPWGKLSGAGAPDVKAVARALDETHHGLQDVKDRIIEYLAVTHLRGGAPPNTTLCLVGPPGVGKTSIAMAVAQGLGRPMQRISLGGVRDEAEIRGHRRTYVGSMPGRILDSLKRAGVDDPVVILDELDKVTSDWRGDPAAALMEVLDPVQNRAFRDTYLELDYDLSRVFFVATANYEDDIPETLLDRLEILRLPGYTDREKEQIARRHLIPTLAEEAGLAEVGDVLTPAALRSLIRFYTREAGVRELSRLIGKIYRRLARCRVEGRVRTRRIGAAEMEKLLGPPPFKTARLEAEPQVGVGTGLAYTGAGGDVLRIECTVSPGKGDFHVTGQLGEIMQESVTAAWGYLKSAVLGSPLLASLWAESVGRAYLAGHLSSGDTPGDPSVDGCEPDHEVPGGPGAAAEGAGGSERQGLLFRDPPDHEILSSLEIRVHLPEGAVPKEGPSAGVAVAAALFSALTQSPLRPRVALSGEITLTGHVLPVGGLKEKVLAALREGVAKVVLPADVRPEVERLPDDLRRDLQFVFVRRFEEVLPHALVACAVEVGDANEENLDGFGVPEERMKKADRP
jgi:ATP-dependent Lon protease